MKTRLIDSLFSVFILFFIGCNNQHTQDDTYSAEIDERINRTINLLHSDFSVSVSEQNPHNLIERMEELKIPGVSITVITSVWTFERSTSKTTCVFSAPRNF